MAPKTTVVISDSEDEKPTDYSEADSAIEAELNKHKLGSFRVHFKDMTFHWKGEKKNRAVASPDKLRVLVKSMKTGLYRSDMRNRISGIVARKDIASYMVRPDDPKKKDKVKDFKEVAKYNEEAKFPIIVLPGKQDLIEMQSGQHRMAVLKKVLFPEEDTEWWWIVTLYDDGMHFPLTID